MMNMEEASWFLFSYMTDLMTLKRTRLERVLLSVLDMPELRDQMYMSSLDIFFTSLSAVLNSTTMNTKKSTVKKVLPSVAM